MNEVNTYNEGKITTINVEELNVNFLKSIDRLFWKLEIKTGWEYLNLIDFSDINFYKKLNDNSNHSEIGYLSKYVKDLSNNVIKIKTNLNDIHEDYKRQIFKIYSIYVGSNLGYSEENLKSILDIDFELEKVVKYFYKIISKRKDFDFNQFVYEADEFVNDKKIRLSLFKILYSKKFNIKNQILDESKLIRIKLNTLVYCIFPTEDINVIDDANNNSPITNNISSWKIINTNLLNQ